MTYLFTLEFVGRAAVTAGFIGLIITGMMFFALPNPIARKVAKRGLAAALLLFIGGLLLGLYVESR